MNLVRLRTVKYWGSSISAHQVEGRLHNQWTVWELAHANELAARASNRLDYLPHWNEIKPAATNADNYVSGIGVDHYDRFEEDFDLAKSLNFNAQRLSVEWSRIEPEPGVWDETAIEHYRQVLRALKRRGLEPFVCLWHWTLPVWFEERGGFAKSENIDLFVRFVEKVTVELGEHLHHIIVLNEPNVYTGLSHAGREWPPQAGSLWQAYKVYRNLMRAHQRSYRLIKSIRQDYQIGIAQHVTHMTAIGINPLNKLYVMARSYLWNWWFINRTLDSHDFIGINYYVSDDIRNFRLANPNQQISDLGWDMRPHLIERAVMSAHRRYNRPIIITENGVADAKDQYRQWWLEETLRGLSQAIADGADVRGYLHWSLLDNFEWAYGYWPRFGLVAVDRQTLARKVRPSAQWLAQLLQRIRQDG